MGENDILWVYPNLMDDNITFPVSASFNGYVDEWTVTFVTPDGMVPRIYATGDDMSIQYIDITGTDTTLVAPLTIFFDYKRVYSHIQTIGYYDYNFDGNLEPYGTVKWAASDYDDMLDITFQFESTFTGGSLTLTGSIKSGNDERQNLVNPNATAFTKTVTVIVGYKPGDVNGDGVIDNSDVTAMIAYSLGNVTGWDEYQIAAGDLNGDGNIDSSDVIILIGMILG